MLCFTQKPVESRKGNVKNDDQEQHKDPRHGLLGRYQELKQQHPKLRLFRTSEIIHPTTTKKKKKIRNKGLALT